MKPINRLNRQLMEGGIKPPGPFTVAFPNGDKFKLSFRAVADHRRKEFLKTESKETWWDHERPRVLAMWPTDHMTWEEVWPHLSPRPSITPYYANRWAAKKVRVNHP